MCEPMHSITQYPDQDDDGNPTGPRVEALLNRPNVVVRFFKKLGSYFHLSKMGAGHSESIGQAFNCSSRYLPDANLWEGAWWERRLHEDNFHRYHYGKQYDGAKEAAQEYFDRVAVGNIGILRRFLETSLNNTEHQEQYVEHMPLILRAKRELLDKIQRFKGKSSNPRDTVTKIVMGYTRKRNLFLPVWADEPKLWLPS